MNGTYSRQRRHFGTVATQSPEALSTEAPVAGRGGQQDAGVITSALAHERRRVSEESPWHDAPFANRRTRLKLRQCIRLTNWSVGRVALPNPAGESAGAMVARSCSRSVHFRVEKRERMNRASRNFGLQRFCVRPGGISLVKQP